MMRVLVFFIALTPALAENRSRIPAAYFKKSPGLNLPDNATSIRENIIDSFSCENRIYGYYADMDNECQIFHVCLPQARYIVRFSFICPTETVFNQATFVCTRNESSIPCEESEKFYNLNEAFGEVEELPGNELDPSTRPPPRPPTKPPSPPPPPPQPQNPQTLVPTLTTPRPTRPTLPVFPTVPQRPTRPTTPQRPTWPTTILPTIPPQRPQLGFQPQTFTSEYPTTFYYQQRLGNRPWQ